MKKLIAIAVVFALVAAGSVFAVDLGGEVIGNVVLLQGDNGDDSKITGDADMKRIRIQGDAEVADGKFFGWFRAEGSGGGDGLPWGSAPAGQVFGHAGWKPIDQLKIWVGSNGGDGFFDKIGQAGWGFYQRATDVHVTPEGDNAWGTGFGTGLTFTKAFFGGNGQNALRATISPVGMVNINFELPFFEHDKPGDVFKALVGQVDLNFDFGNIAITYAGDASDASNGTIYGFFELGSIDRLTLDIGLGFTLPGVNDVLEPIAAGVGAKFDITDAFGFKARVAASFAGDDKAFRLIGDVLPYFAINDNLKIFASLGLAMLAPDVGDAVVGWHMNPYVWIGQEWGPTFWAGFKIWGDAGDKSGGSGDKNKLNWAVPIAIAVSF